MTKLSAKFAMMMNNVGNNDCHTSLSKGKTCNESSRQVILL